MRESKNSIDVLDMETPRVKKLRFAEASAKGKEHISPEGVSWL